MPFDGKCAPVSAGALRPALPRGRSRPTACPYPAPGCHELTNGGRCERHRRGAQEQQGTTGQRDYGTRWGYIRKAYIYANPWCLSCRRAWRRFKDHFPPQQRRLVAQGVADPDAWQASTRCAPCVTTVRPLGAGLPDLPRTPGSPSAASTHTPEPSSRCSTWMRACATRSFSPTPPTAKAPCNCWRPATVRTHASRTASTAARPPASAASPAATSRSTPRGWS